MLVVAGSEARYTERGGRLLREYGDREADVAR